MKILIIDNFFPTQYYKWEQEELLSFIQNYDVDILVKNLGKKYRYNVAYDEMKSKYQLDSWKLLIFDTRFSSLQKYNGLIVDMDTSFTYLFSKTGKFDLKQYDLVYHIFYQSYQLFNKEFNFPQNKQMIHLYPGGGYSKYDIKLQINKQVKIVSTQSFISNNLKEQHFNYIECFGCTFLQRNTTPIRKKLNNGKLNIVFTCFGWGGEKVLKIKGYFAYISTIKYIKNIDSSLFKNCNFYCVGYIPEEFKIKEIQYRNRLSQKELDLFYQSTIDIKINLQNGEMDGWPLGIEAMLQGVVQIITDIKNLNIKNKFNFTNEHMIILPNNYSEKNIYEHLSKLNNDRSLLTNISKNIQDKCFDLFSYENQQQKIFNYINSNF